MLTLYIYIFTDDQNPQDIIDRYKPHLKSSNITFDCRKEDNHYYTKIKINDEK